MPHADLFAGWRAIGVAVILVRMFEIELDQFRDAHAPFTAWLKPLADHLTDFETSLKAKNNTDDYVTLKISRIRRILEGCKLRYLSDISGSKLQAYLAELRNGSDKVSHQTSNFYLQAFQQFCRWLHIDRRAGESPIRHLQGLNVKLDQRHPRRALSLDEFSWLLHATENGPERGNVSGAERALLYRVAAETGLRANELASLTVGSFQLGVELATVTLLASNSKHRRQDILPVKKSTAVLLKQHFASKMPAAPAFKMPTQSMRAKVMKRDLEAARAQWLNSADDPEAQEKMLQLDFLLYKDSAGRFADFHSLRHTTGSFLAAAGVSPKVAQTIMRHSDINLTMSLYTHSYRENEASAVENLPDLSQRPPEKRKAEPS